MYRQRAGLSRKTVQVERELERLYSFDTLKRDVESTLSGARVRNATKAEVMALIESEERRRSESIGRLRDAIAVYQGQATLGRIINVVLHEGRRPLSFFQNQFPLLRSRADEFAEAHDPDLVPDIVGLAEGIADNASDFVSLFRRLDPLAAQRRSRKREERLPAIIDRAKQTFSSQMDEAGVNCEIRGDDDLSFLCWRQDIQAIFTNLIDNSLYWLGTTNASEKNIYIDMESERGRLLHVDYRDNGPGIDPEHIASGVIFDPHFSTKSDGTGLGLAIAGEAATRNGLDLTALEHELGAWFRLQPVDEERENGGDKA